MYHISPIYNSRKSKTCVTMHSRVSKCILFLKIVWYNVRNEDRNSVLVTYVNKHLSYSPYFSTGKRISVKMCNIIYSSSEYKVSLYIFFCLSLSKTKRFQFCLGYERNQVRNSTLKVMIGEENYLPTLRKKIETTNQTNYHIKTFTLEDFSFHHLCHTFIPQ